MRRSFVCLILALCSCPRATTPAQTADKTADKTAPSPPRAAPSSEPQAPAPATPKTPQREPLPALEGVHYLEVVLGEGQAETPLPMIVAIHGLGDDPRNFAHLFDAFPEPARLILPRGLDAWEGGGYSWFPHRARGPDVEALSQSISHAAGEVARAIDALAKTRPTVGKPIVTGFSQGGMLTFGLAVLHPDSVGAAFATGGWLPPPLWPETAPAGLPRIVAFHGTADAAVPFEPTRQSVEHLQGLGAPVTLEVYDGVGHTIPPPMRRDLYDGLVDAVRAAKTD